MMSTMRSVADDLRAEARQALAILSPAERLELALRLGDEDIQLLSAARGIPRDDAVAVARRTRQLGRIGSACMERQE